MLVVVLIVAVAVVAVVVAEQLVLLLSLVEKFEIAVVVQDCSVCLQFLYIADDMNIFVDLQRKMYYH